MNPAFMPLLLMLGADDDALFAELITIGYFVEAMQIYTPGMVAAQVRPL